MYHGVRTKAIVEGYQLHNPNLRVRVCVVPEGSRQRIVSSLSNNMEVLSPGLHHHVDHVQSPDAGHKYERYVGLLQ